MSKSAFAKPLAQMRIEQSRCGGEAKIVDDGFGVVSRVRCESSVGSHVGPCLLFNLDFDVSGLAAL